MHLRTCRRHTPYRPNAPHTHPPNSAPDTYWDPCGPSVSGCPQHFYDDDFEGPCEFHPNIISQDCHAQAAWLVDELKKVPRDDWLIIIAHHPADEIGACEHVCVCACAGACVCLHARLFSLRGTANVPTNDDPTPDVVDFAAILQASPHHVDIYLNGHVHTLNQYTVDKYGAYVTSGAGAMVWTTDQLSPSVNPKLAGLDIGVEASSSNHSYET